MLTDRASIRISSAEPNNKVQTACASGSQKTSANTRPVAAVQSLCRASIRATCLRMRRTRPCSLTLRISSTFS
jgi:hypothetical protein